jgi:type VII secretion protein EccB
MPSTPTTKSQVQAYRFVLRRMESALVRKDPVMLHDPMRSHQRSTIVGAIIGVVGLVGFLVFGILKPAPNVPTKGIVIASPSGQMYVVSDNPHELIPVYNLASARLLLAATSSNGNQSASGGQGQTASKVEQPTSVGDDQLKGIPVGRMTGIPDGPTALPSPGGHPAAWAVCDDLPRDVSAQNQTGGRPPRTSVLVGMSSLGTNLGDAEALLVTGPDNKTYLVYHRQHNLNDENDSAVRALVNLSDTKLASALQLENIPQRQISQALLNAIPAVGEIKDPFRDNGMLTGQSGPPGLTNSSNGQQLTIGQSFEVQNANGVIGHYVVLRDGIQFVNQTVAQIAQYEYDGNSGTYPQVSGAELSNFRQLTNQLQGIDDYPGNVPAVITGDNKPTVCLNWSADYTDPAVPKYKTQVTTDHSLRMPADPAVSGAPMNKVAIGQGTASGKIDSFFMNPSTNAGGVVVRAASNAKEFASGPIYIVDQRGLKFSVPDSYTAGVLGVGDGTAQGGIPPAPEAIMSFLPVGSATLSIQAVQHTYDSLPMQQNAGLFMTPTNQAGN